MYQRCNTKLIVVFALHYTTLYKSQCIYSLTSICVNTLPCLMKTCRKYAYDSYMYALPSKAPPESLLASSFWSLCETCCSTRFPSETRHAQLGDSSYVVSLNMCCCSLRAYQITLLFFSSNEGDKSHPKRPLLFRSLPCNDNSDKSRFLMHWSIIILLESLAMKMPRVPSK